MKRLRSIAGSILILMAPALALWPVTVAVLVPAVVTQTGCALFRGESVASNAGKAGKIAFTTIDSFITYEHEFNQTGALGADTRNAAEVLRAKAPMWTESFHSLLAVYKAESTEANASNLMTALATIQAAAIEATKNLVKAKAQ